MIKRVKLDWKEPEWKPFTSIMSPKVDKLLVKLFKSREKWVKEQKKHIKEYL